ncbi:MAG: iron ABC transporter permease [Synergistaceae bacterium]|nr:iron ABC transporter permease [Synergistaceae bacterium]
MIPVLALIVISIWRISLGEWDISFPDVIRFLLTESNSPEAIVVQSVRLPRLLCSMGTGGLLSVSGVILQGLLANPLAEPYTLGIASGAAFGASLGILFGTFNFMVMPCALGGSLLALMITGLTSRNGGRNNLILAGVISNAILSAGVTFLKAIAGDKIGAVVLWLMGSFSGAGWRDVRAVALGAVIVSFPAYVFGNALDAMSLGENRASVFGVNENFVRTLLLLTTSAGTALCVSSFGVIGFVGLVVPHISRAISGASHRKLMTNAFFTGAGLMCAADGLAQSIGEIPAGVITALAGGPFFCWILSRKK